MEWEQIETAPKDGTAVLTVNGDWICIRSWDDGKYSRNPKPYWRCFGPWSVTFQRQRQPTHWMPLPKPPAPT